MYSVREVIFRADAHSNHTGSFAQCKGKTVKKPRFSAVFLSAVRVSCAPAAAENFRARIRESHVMLSLGQQTKGE
jgi:hypothetical protein